jgi:hypothetical protein
MSYFVSEWDKYTDSLWGCAKKYFTPEKQVVNSKSNSCKLDSIKKAGHSRGGGNLRSIAGTIVFVLFEKNIHSSRFSIGDSRLRGNDLFFERELFFEYVLFCGRIPFEQPPYF